MAYDPNVLRRATEALEEQRRVHQLNTARLRADAYRRQPRKAGWPSSFSVAVSSGKVCDFKCSYMPSSAFLR